MIGIIAAMPEEIVEIEKEVEISKKVTIGQRVFHVGTMHGKAVVLVLARIGKVAAATTATTLITSFNVSAIVLTGIAGAVADNVRIGDIVIGDSFIQHDMDASPSTLFEKYEIPLLGVKRIAADFSLCDAAMLAAAQVIKRYPSSSVHCGLIGSGDQFIASAKKIQQLRKEIPELLCVEMEGAAVAQVCFEYQVPFTVIRSISDKADDSAHVDFMEFVKTVCAPISRELAVSTVQHVPFHANKGS